MANPDHGPGLGGAGRSSPCCSDRIETFRHGRLATLAAGMRSDSSADWKREPTVRPNSGGDSFLPVNTIDGLGGTLAAGCRSAPTAEPAAASANRGNGDAAQAFARLADAERLRRLCCCGRRGTAPARAVGSSQCESTSADLGWRPTLSTAALSVAEQSGRAGAVTGEAWSSRTQRWSRRWSETCLCCRTGIFAPAATVSECAASRTAGAPPRPFASPSGSSSPAAA